MGNVEAQCVGSECIESKKDEISILSLEEDPQAYVNAIPMPGLTPITVWESSAADDNDSKDWSAREGNLMQLFAAVHEDDAPRLLQLFVDGMDMDDMEQALSLAAKSCSVNVVRELVGIGCNVRFVDKKFNLTPLHLAACSGHPDTVDILIDAMADIDAKCRGITALGFAQRHGNVEVQEVIEKYKAHAGSSPRENMSRRHVVLPRVSEVLTKSVMNWDFCGPKLVVATKCSMDEFSEFSYHSETELISNVSTYAVNDSPQSPSRHSLENSGASDGTTPKGGESDSVQDSSNDSSSQKGGEHFAGISDLERSEQVAETSSNR